VIAGILLAAGEGRRFGGGKLLQPLADGTPLALAAADTLRRGGVERVMAVVRPDDPGLARHLEGAGAEAVPSAASERGMGASLAAGVAAAPEAEGWLIALADMPWIAPATVAAVAGAVRAGALLAAPVHGGRGGHPVGFSAALGDELRALDGDAGARGVVAGHRQRLVQVAVDDPGVLRDVDEPGDLREGPPPGGDPEGGRGGL